MKDKKLKKYKPLKPLAIVACWFYCLPFAKFKLKIKADKSKMRGIKPPYIVLANHCSVEDFKVCAAVLYPLTPYYITAYNQFIKREKLARMLGCVPKRQFAIEPQIIRQIDEIIKNNGIVTIYIESKLTTDGRTGVIPKAIAKLIKLVKAPVVILKSHGAYLDKPKWSDTRRNAPIETSLFPILNANEIENLSIDEIYAKVYAAIDYDEFRYQRENNIVVSNPNRAKNLHTILYKCPNCKTEFEMSSSGYTLSCNHCGKSWELDELGVIKAQSGDTEFFSVTEWYDFQIQEVKTEILDGRYIFQSKVELYSLPDFRGYVRLGSGNVTHTKEGFLYQGEIAGELSELKFSSKSLYAIAYDIDKSFDLNNETTYRFFPDKKEQLTKVSIAVEEIYKLI